MPNAIALLSAICHALQIDTLDVLTATQTKRNFLPFTPGLVGGTLSVWIHTLPIVQKGRLPSRNHPSWTAHQ
jgi:UDP-N-acetyl-D-mannosaminuronate dehydrogenase